MNSKLRGYLVRIQRAHPDVNIAEVMLNQDGLVNDVVIVNGNLVCRFGKHEWAADDLRQEYRCLELARRHVEICLPVWTMHEDEFISYAMIDGVPLQRHYLMETDDVTRQAIGRQLGTLLRQLHTIPISQMEAKGIKPSVTNRTHEQWLDWYTTVQRDLFPYLMAGAREWVHHHFAPLLKEPTFMEAEKTFMHGDLATYHLLYDPDAKRLNGLIDFGTAGIGDPACDLALIIEEFGESFLHYLDPYYPDIGLLIERARFLAGNLELEWLLGGLRNPADLTWFAAHIGRARDIMPIGCGW